MQNIFWLTDLLILFVEIVYMFKQGKRGNEDSRLHLLCAVHRCGNTGRQTETYIDIIHKDILIAILYTRV